MQKFNLECLDIPRLKEAIAASCSTYDVYSKDYWLIIDGNLWTFHGVEGGYKGERHLISKENIGSEIEPDKEYELPDLMFSAESLDNLILKIQTSVL